MKIKHVCIVVIVMVINVCIFILVPPSKASTPTPEISQLQLPNNKAILDMYDFNVAIDPTSSLIPLTKTKKGMITLLRFFDRAHNTIKHTTQYNTTKEQQTIINEYSINIANAQDILYPKMRAFFPQIISRQFVKSLVPGYCTAYGNGFDTLGCFGTTLINTHTAIKLHNSSTMALAQKLRYNLIQYGFKRHISLNSHQPQINDNHIN